MGRGLWLDKSANWIFNPFNVVTSEAYSVDHICKDSLGYTMNGFVENYNYNAEKLAINYLGDSRNVVEGKSVEQAMKELMTFKGMGTGIANLFILYLEDRGLASLTDSGECRVKVDVHKARIPLNTGCVVSEKNLRRDVLVSPLEYAYLEVCKESDLDAKILDPALWVIGSELCAKRNYKICFRECLLEELCGANIAQDGNTATFQIYDADGEILDSRKNRKQLLLF